MPDENMRSTTLYRPCANCGDLMPLDARLCPHCGAAGPSDSPILSAGLTVVRILLAFGIALISVPLGACGACVVFWGATSFNPGIFALGAALLALGSGGIWVIAQLLRERHGKEVKKQ